MKKSVELLTSLATVFLILMGAIDIMLQMNYVEFLTEAEKANMLLDRKMVCRCISKIESINFTMSSSGLNGDCGIIPNYNPQKKCDEICTYGENITGSKLALDTLSLVNKAPRDSIEFLGGNISRGILVTLRWVFFILALLFSIVAIFKGFSKK